MTPTHTDRRAADRLLLRAGRHGGPWVGVLALTTTVLAAAETVLPAALGRAVDGVVGHGGATPWLTGCGLLVALLVACDIVDDLATGMATARSTAWLRHTVLGHFLALGARAGERFSPGDVAGRLVGSTTEAGRAGPDLVRAAGNMVPAAGALVALALIDPWLCVTALVAMPLLVLLVRAFVRDASDLATRYLEVQGRIAGRLVGALGGARTIAAAGTADREAERVLDLLPELHRHGMGMWRAQARIAAQDALLVPLLEVAVLAVAGLELARGRITPGGMLAAAQYAVLATTVSAAVSSVTRLTRARAGAARVEEVLRQPAIVYGTASLPPGRGTVELRGVTVRAGDRAVLERVDLLVPGGALVAVVGRSGAGKSTLAGLIGRLLDADEGEVLLDGVPLRLIDRLELRREVGYGFERPALFGGTLAGAIGFGAWTPSGGEVVAAACAARADGFIRRLPGGYRHSLAGAPMSGGEAQRVGLARTFAHAGRVLVLDDVAASLDTVTEHHISEVLAGSLGGRTRILVAHRPSTAARADTVVWLDEGRVRMVGTHAELWGNAGYRALFEPDAPVRPHTAGAAMEAGAA